jgi:hypothetical protein
MGVESGGGRWCSGADEVVVAVGHYVRKCEVGEGAEGSISGAPSEMGVNSDEGRWCDGADEGVVVVVGCCIHKRKAGEGVWAKKLKPSCHSSILGAPYKTAKGDGAEGWCGGVYEVAVAVGLCTRKA